MNHNGNFDLCYELIKQSKLSGADIVKFQLDGEKKEKCQINKTIIEKLTRSLNILKLTCSLLYLMKRLNL